VRTRTEAGELVRFLEWDSKFFGFRIATVMRRSLDAAALDQVIAWCGEQRIECLYYLSEATDAAALKLARERGLRFVDVRVTYQMPVDPSRRESKAPTTAAIRLVEPDDVPGMKRLAAASHTLSRFWTDEGFPRDKCAELYALWLEKSCQGDAEAVWIAELDGRAAGYLTCHLRPESVGEIGLVGVDPEAKGHGLGRALTERSIAWFREKGCTSSSVVTQGSNVAAHRLYESAGYRTSAVQYWHHLWLRSGEDPRP
jgi:dTDP-4-amino-4,6-dideoxy-D-galactose acyltransferase